MARPRQTDPMLVRTDKNWDALMEALGSQFRTPFRDICHDFKCSRAWAERYVKPNVHRIYVSGDRAGVAAFAAHGSLPDGGVSATWYDTSEYQAWAERSSSVFERTKRIPLPLIAPDPTPLIEKAQMFDAAGGRDADPFWRYGEAKSAWRRAFSLSDGDSAAEVLDEDAGERGRGSVPWLASDRPLGSIRFFAHECVTPASLLDWGDASEIAHRKIQCNGMLKIEFKVEDADGVRGERVLYAADPRPVPPAPELSCVMRYPELVKRVYVNLDKFYELSGGVVPDWESIDDVRMALGMRPLSEILG